MLVAAVAELVPAVVSSIVVKLSVELIVVGVVHTTVVVSCAGDTDDNGLSDF